MQKSYNQKAPLIWTKTRWPEITIYLILEVDKETLRRPGENDWLLTVLFALTRTWDIIKVWFLRKTLRWVFRNLRIHSNGAIFPFNKATGSAANLAWSWNRTMRRDTKLHKIVVPFIKRFHPQTLYLGPEVSLVNCMSRKIWKTTATRCAIPVLFKNHFGKR